MSKGLCMYICFYKHKKQFGMITSHTIDSITSRKWGWNVGQDIHFFIYFRINLWGSELFYLILGLFCISKSSEMKIAYLIKFFTV